MTNTEVIVILGIIVALIFLTVFIVNYGPKKQLDEIEKDLQNLKNSVYTFKTSHVEKEKPIHKLTIRKKYRANKAFIEDVYKIIRDLEKESSLHAESLSSFVTRIESEKYSQSSILALKTYLKFLANSKVIKKTDYF